jgi:hypothetical protein
VVYKNVSGYFLLKKTKCGEIAKCHVFNSVIYFSVQYLTSFPISAVFNSATCLYLMICVCRSTIFPLLILYNDVRNPMSQQVFLRYRTANDCIYVVMKRHLCVEARLSALSAAILTSNGLIDRFSLWPFLTAFPCRKRVKIGIFPVTYYKHLIA